VKPERFLASRWLFTREELFEAICRQGERSPATVDSHIARWRREGRVRRVKRGLYVRLEERSFDPLAIASRLAPDATLAYHTAMEAHGFAHSVLERLTFATWTKVGRVRFEGREFVPVRPRAALLHSAETARWTERIERSSVEAEVTTLERTVVDLLDRPDLCGGVQEVWRSCQHVPALDVSEVVAYVEALGIRSLAAKAGFLLQQRAEEFAVPDRSLARLRDRAPRAPVYVQRGAKGSFVKDWNLFVPAGWLPQFESETA
jgi:predicted transcriptional regulator of viral defense system